MAKMTIEIPIPEIVDDLRRQLRISEMANERKDKMIKKIVHYLTEIRWSKDKIATLLGVTVELLEDYFD